MKSRDNNQMSDVTCDLSRGIDFEPFCFTITSDGFPEVIGMPVRPRNEAYEPGFMPIDQEPLF